MMAVLLELVLVFALCMLMSSLWFVAFMLSGAAGAVLAGAFAAM